MSGADMDLGQVFRVPFQQNRAI